MRLRAIVMALLALVVGAGIAGAFYYFSANARLESERHSVQQSIDHRTEIIETLIWRGVRQIDLLVAFYESSTYVDSNELAIYLRSMWMDYPALNLQASSPIAMGWVDISRAGDNSVVIYREGHRRPNVITPDFHKVLDEVAIRANTRDGAVIYYGRADRGKFGAWNGPYISILRPAFHTSASGNRILKGVAYAVIDLRALFAATRSAYWEEPLLTAHFDDDFHADRDDPVQQLIVDEVAASSLPGDTIVPVWAPAIRQFEIGNNTFTLHYYRDASWSYAQTEPLAAVRMKLMWQALSVVWSPRCCTSSVSISMDRTAFNAA